MITMKAEMDKIREEVAKKREAIESSSVIEGQTVIVAQTTVGKSNASASGSSLKKVKVETSGLKEAQKLDFAVSKGGETRVTVVSSAGTTHAYNHGRHQSLRLGQRWQSIYAGPTVDQISNLEKKETLHREYLTTDAPAASTKLTSIALGKLITIKLRDQPYISLGAYSKGPYQPATVCMSMGCCSNANWLVSEVDETGAFTLRPAQDCLYKYSATYLAVSNTDVVMSFNPTWWIISDFDKDGYVRLSPKETPASFIT